MLNSFTIKSLAKEIGFSDCGIARADRLTEEEYPLDAWLAEGYNADMEYMGRNAEMRRDPRLLVEGARSVISLVLAYKPDRQMEGRYKIAQYAYGEDYHERLKRMSYQLIAKIREHYPDFEGRPFVDTAPISDRHWAVRAGLGWIGKNTLFIHPIFGSYCFLAEIVTPADFDQYSNSKLLNSKLSKLSKLEDIGNSKLSKLSKLEDVGNSKLSKLSKLEDVENSKLSKLSKLEDIGNSKLSKLSKLEDIGNSKLSKLSKLEEIEVIENSSVQGDLQSPCSNCNLCVDACPNHAIVPIEQSELEVIEDIETNTQAFNQSRPNRRRTTVVQAFKCTSYNTIENRADTLPAELNTRGYIFGCDICQLVCPYNRDVPPAFHLTDERKKELESIFNEFESPNFDNFDNFESQNFDNFDNFESQNFDTFDTFELQKSKFNKLRKHSALSRIKFSQLLRNLRSAVKGDL